MRSCEPRSNGVDARTGTLVWVRRPNGSWWPGVVTEPDELSVGRKGMPVKLLGRESGALDWYNLEKSLRIKVFRCGEYDWCIEKAKISALRSKTINAKGKYARREDAILDALELEKAYYYSRDTKFNSDSELLNALPEGSDGSLYGLFDVPVFIEENNTEDCPNLAAQQKQTGMLENQPFHSNAVLQTTQQKILSTGHFSGAKKNISKSSSKMNFKYSITVNKDIYIGHTTVPHAKGRPCQCRSQDRTSECSYLCEVNVDVQASRKGFNVALVSLKSEIYEKSIVGHPVSVNVVEDGSYDAYMNDFCPKGDFITLYEEDVVFKQHSAIVDVPLFQDGYGCQISSSENQRILPNLVASQSRSTRKKASKIRKSGLLLRKIRKLSSITIEQEYRRSEIAVEKLDRTDGACIPVKLVFNRISEALGCFS